MVLIAFGESLLSPLKEHNNLLLTKGVSFILSLREGAHRLFANPLLAIQAFMISCAVWGTTMLAIWFALLGFPDFPNSLGVVCGQYGPSPWRMVVAPTPGFIGVYEALLCHCTLALGSRQSCWYRLCSNPPCLSTALYHCHWFCICPQRRCQSQTVGQRFQNGNGRARKNLILTTDINRLHSKERTISEI